MFVLGWRLDVATLSRHPADIIGNLALRRQSINNTNGSWAAGPVGAGSLHIPSPNFTCGETPLACFFSGHSAEPAALKTKVMAIDEAWYGDWLRVDLT